MGSAFTVFSVLFAGGALLFLVVTIMSALALKDGGGFSAKPHIAALLYALSAAMMIAPAYFLSSGAVQSGDHAFRLFFGKPATSTIVIDNSISGRGAEHAEIMFTFTASSGDEFEAFASHAKLKRVADAKTPKTDGDAPDWWMPDVCDGARRVYVARPDANWDRKWATFCEADNRAYAYAVWRN